jgi:hypothetical protein
MMEKTCKCGRVWQLTSQKFIFRDPGTIICKCGEIIQHWNRSRTWTAELVKGLLEDEGQSKPCTYE